MDENIKKEANKKQEESVHINESTDSTPELKACPYCGETILATAKKCKHCGEWLVQPSVVNSNTPQSASVGIKRPMVVTNPPRSKNYMIVLVVWIMVALGLLKSVTKTSFVGIDVMDYMDDIVFIYFMFGMKKYAQYKGIYSIAFSWVIGLSIALLFASLVSEVLWIIGLIFMALLIIPYYVFLFGMRNAFKRAKEQYLAASFMVYLIISFVILFLVLCAVLSDVDERIYSFFTVIECFINLCFYAIWCKSFYGVDTESDTSVITAGGEKRSFAKKFFRILLIIGAIVIGISLLALLLFVSGDLFALLGM